MDLSRADIVLIGDSFVEAAELPRSNTMVAQLRLRLNATTANLGQSNYGPQQELVVLERYALSLSPKVVLWFFFGGNDLRDADRYERLHGHPERLADPSPFSSRSFTRNALTALARLTTPPRHDAAPAAQRRAAEFISVGGRRQTVYFDDPEGPWTPHQWEIATNTLLHARDLTSRSRADLLVVYIPRKFRVYRGYIRTPPNSEVGSWTSNDLPDVLSRWCDEHAIDFLDSTRILRKAVSLGEPVYLQDDVHWNARGHEVVSDAIAQHIRARRAFAVGTGISIGKRE